MTAPNSNLTFFFQRTKNLSKNKNEFLAFYLIFVLKINNKFFFYLFTPILLGQPDTKGNINNNNKNREIMCIQTTAAAKIKRIPSSKHKNGENDVFKQLFFFFFDI